MNLLREESIASHLLYGLLREGLRTPAYAQLVAKSLLLQIRHTKASLDRIQRAIAEMGGARPPRDEILQALRVNCVAARAQRDCKVGGTSDLADRFRTLLTRSGHDG